MNIVSVENLSKTIDEKLLFTESTFGVDKGEKIGLISPNGTGKSTLLRILAEKSEYDSGTLSRSRELRVDLLEQAPLLPEGITLKDFFFLGKNPLIKLINTYYTYLETYDHTPSGEKKLEILTEEMDRANAWEIENKYHSLLNEFNLSDRERRMDTLSGGMKKKALLARTLASNADLLLLDEPTNHLDIDTIEWLENYLKGAVFSFIMVTHDRYFLDRVCTHIMEIDHSRIYKYKGNYTTFLQRKKERLSIEQNEQVRIQTILKRELEWLKRGPRARAGKDKKRKERIQDLMDAKIQKEHESAEFTSSNRRMGKKVLILNAVTKEFSGKTVIAPFSYRFKKGERIGILGANGSGKSTFLNLVEGRILPDRGTIDRGVHTTIGYYDQLSEPLSKKMSVLEFMNKRAERIILANGTDISSARFLEMFNFPARMHRLPVSMLSGGEKRRLLLISILAGNPNFLILDEPTNDLDIITMQKLEEYLIDFQGTLLIVSHDRAFLDRTTDYLFIFDGEGTIQGFSGNYSAYREGKEDSPAQEQEKIKRQHYKKNLEKEEKAGLTFKEREELNRLFTEIDTLEKEKELLEKSFSDSSLSPKEINAYTRQYTEILRIIEKKTYRWEELAQYE